MDNPVRSGRSYQAGVTPGPRFATALLPLAVALGWLSARSPAQVTGASKPPPRVALMGHFRRVYSVA